MPDGIVDTLWFDVAEQCEEWGDEFDVWQDGLGQLALGLRSDGLYAATVGGITLSIPRQVAKTFIVGRIVFALCALFPGLKVLWTAHRTRTATNTFKSLQGFARRKKVAPYIAHIRTANGEQEIGFRNGSVIMFGAREQGFGRGFDEVDVEVFDEAQILTEKALEDMIAATLQSRHPHGALLFYMGTPPRPTDPGDAFSQRRAEALSGKSEDALYVECSADANVGKPDGPSLDDRDQWAKANPSFPHRTPLRSLLRLRKNLTSDDAWRREALGVWDEAAVGGAFGPGKWESCEGDPPQGIPMAALGVAVSMDLTHAALVAAGMDSDGVTHVQPLQHGPGTAWVAARAAEIQAQHGVTVVVDGRGPAAVLIPELERVLGDSLRIATTANVLDACAGIFGRVQDGTLRHASYPELNAAVAAAVKRSVNDRWAWGRKASGSDISTLEAATLADWIANGEDSESVYETRGLVTL